MESFVSQRRGKVQALTLAVSSSYYRAGSLVCVLHSMNKL